MTERSQRFRNGTWSRRSLRRIQVYLQTAAIVLLVSCGGGGSAGGPPPPPPPPGVTVSVTPGTASVPLGGAQSFHATVNGSSDLGVIWQVNRIPGGTPATGTVDPGGMYTAPRVMPSPSMVSVTAVSHADPLKDANAQVTISSDVSVTIQPGSASVELGAMRTFAANVTGSGNPLGTVTWSLAGPGCVGAACGTISATGGYTAPQILASPPMAVLTATSDADPSRKSSANVTVTSQFTLTVSGPSSVNPAATVPFTATVNPLPGSNPSMAMNWSVSGPGCTGANNPCGMISSFGLYTAPSAAPQPNSIMITATSVADPSKSASTTTQLITQPSITVTPGNANVALEHLQQFSAAVSGLPNTAVQWYVNNLLGGDPSTVGAISNGAATNGLYAAPVDMVPGRQVTIKAQSVSNSSVSGSVTAALTSSVMVMLAPASASLTTGSRQTFLATVANSSDLNVQWTVNDVPGGNAASGIICVAGSNPCQQPPPGGTSVNVDYQAPAAVPTSPTVTLKAISVADPLQLGSAMVTVLSQVMVSLSPPSATVPPTSTQQFLATVIGSPDQNVTWDVNGFANGALSLGLICLPGSNPCQAPNGAISGPVEYRAPPTPPTPTNTVTVNATSELGSGISQGATVTVGTGPFLFALLPASVATSLTQPFTMRIEGVQFVAGVSGAGSTVTFGGTPKTTNCASTAECDITIDPVDVPSPGLIPVTIENPGSPPMASNVVNFVAVLPSFTEDIISLDVANPLATGKDIVVVEPATAGAVPAIRLTLQAVGIFDSVNAVCALGSTVVKVTRPITGNSSVSLCLVGTSLNGVNTVTFSGPSPLDLTAANLSGGLGTISLAFTLTVPSSAQPGLRSVFVSGVNGDKASLSGSLEVE